MSSDCMPANDVVLPPGLGPPLKAVPAARGGEQPTTRPGVDRWEGLVGASPVMRTVYDQIERVAHTRASVLISGETGTGKDVVAQLIHSLSRCSRQRFVALNCGAVAGALIETELFGHERGSFTGAERMHQGYFERAHGGTLFLDEITEMPRELQIRLLRVLETSTVGRVGGSETIRVDVRIVAATSRDPDEAVAEGRLRQDLLYRLNVFPLRMPALREREGDVPLLAHRFLRDLNVAEGTAKKLTPKCLECLCRHPWPGNVRELKNVIHRAFILAEGGDIGEDCLLLAPPAVAAMVPPSVGQESAVVLPLGASLADAERSLILATLAHLGGQKVRTAKTLGISLKTLYNRLSQYGLGRCAAGSGAPAWRN